MAQLMTGSFKWITNSAVSISPIAKWTTLLNQSFIVNHKQTAQSVESKLLKGLLEGQVNCVGESAKLIMPADACMKCQVF